MKVILLSSIPKVGAVNEIVEVSDGYAQNYLIPQRLAEAATDRNVAELSEQIEANKARDAERQQALERNLAEANGVTVTIVRDANDQGTLFSAIAQSDIAKELEEQKGISLDEAYILLDNPLKETGTHNIELSTNGTKAAIKVDIKAEEPQA